MDWTSSVRSARASLRALACLAAAALMAAALAGCSGDSKPGATATSAVATPTIDPYVLATIANPESMALSPVAGAGGRYTIDLAPGWQSGPVNAAGEEEFNLTQEGRVAAQIGILCDVPISRLGAAVTPTEYADMDLQYVRQLRGNAVASPVPLVVAGIPAASVLYETKFATLNIRQKAVHFVTDSCHWSIRLRVFVPGDMAGYLAVFDRMVATFRPS